MHRTTIRLLQLNKLYDRSQRNKNRLALKRKDRNYNNVHCDIPKLARERLRYANLHRRYTSGGMDTSTTGGGELYAIEETL